jgi:thiol-disulfide isomerase/thioredoxin
MDRVEFVTLLGFMLAGSTSPLPSGRPLPTASPSPAARQWDDCDVNPVLPYNRPIGLKMRVLDGPDFDLVKYRGQALLLHIFATWCGPCNREMPHVVEAAQEYAPRGLAVIGIDSREEDDTVRAFRKRYDISFPIAMDGDGTFTRVLEVGGTSSTVNFPVTLFIDPNGYLYCEVVGGMSRSELRYRIERFLAVSAPALAPKPSPSSSPGRCL